MDNSTNICEATSQSHELDNYRPTHRKGKKLLAEKKRRARINHCLMQIRDIVCEGEEEKDTDLEKMEKAEILEKTLEVLTRLRHDHKSHTSSTFTARKAMAVRYASGFSSCAEESIRYIQNSRLVPAEVKVQLQSHLRGIAHRMETSLQGDNQDLSFTPHYQTSTSSSSLSSERLTSLEDLREDTSDPVINRISGSIQDSGIYFTPSPIHFSTPGVQTHTPLSSTMSQLQHLDQDCLSSSPDICIKHKFIPKTKCTENLTPDCASNISQQMTSLATETYSLFHHPQTLSTECSPEKNLISSMKSPSSSYPLSMPSINEVITTTNSPVILYSSPMITNTPSLSDQSVFSYHVYEAYPTLPSILVQPITYVTSPHRQSHTAVSTVTKQPSTLSNAINLCVKRSEDHQISPETMWRPW